MHGTLCSFHNYREEATRGRRQEHRSITDTARPFGDAAAVADAGRVAHSARITDPGAIRANDDGEMRISSVVGDRSSDGTASVGAAQPVADSAEKARLPFDGYDRLDAKQLKRGLSDHSQIELEAIENYERSHRGRESVLNKLRYLRGSEPFAGYDALSVEEILSMLKEADLPTITRVRGYERKFANRPPVLDEVARVHRERRATQPASAAPAYRPTSARSGAKQKSGP
jgi:hypothetical protein